MGKLAVINKENVGKVRVVTVLQEGLFSVSLI